MATCKKCIHVDMCYLIEHYGNDADTEGVEFDCQNFHDNNAFGKLMDRYEKATGRKPEGAVRVAGRKRGRCKYCGGNDNDFHVINSETVAYSGIEIAINRLGLLRVRTYDDYECETALPISSEIIQVSACPKCGAYIKG